LQSKDNRIPIYGADKRKVAQNFLKKPKRPEMTKSYIKMQDLVSNILQERELLRGERLRLTDFQFNPNCKVSPFECQSNPFARFTVLKRDFDYLNEMVSD
jgi:hypothetical protein